MCKSESIRKKSKVININVTVVYMVRGLNDFDAATSITRAIGRGGGPENLDFFGGTEIARSNVFCHLGPKSRDFHLYSVGRLSRGDRIILRHKHVRIAPPANSA